MSHYDTVTKPALRDLLRAALSGPDAPAPTRKLKELADAAAAAGATSDEIADVMGGREAWNAFVRQLRVEGLI